MEVLMFEQGTLSKIIVIYLNKKFVIESPSDTFWKEGTWKRRYGILSRIRCVNCGRKGAKARNYAGRLLGKVICNACTKRREYRTCHTLSDNSNI
jgi:hypothetical protein